MLLLVVETAAIVSVFAEEIELLRDSGGGACVSIWLAGVPQWVVVGLGAFAGENGVRVLGVCDSDSDPFVSDCGCHSPFK